MKTRQTYKNMSDVNGVSGLQALALVAVLGRVAGLLFLLSFALLVGGALGVVLSHCSFF
jgi:hypothetical protein